MIIHNNIPHYSQEEVLNSLIKHLKRINSIVSPDNPSLTNKDYTYIEVLAIAFSLLPTTSPTTKPTILKEYIKQYNGYNSDSIVEWSNDKATPFWVQEGTNLVHAGTKLIWIRGTHNTAGKGDYIVMPHRDFTQWTIIKKEDILNYTII